MPPPIVYMGKQMIIGTKTCTKGLLGLTTASIIINPALNCFAGVVNLIQRQTIQSWRLHQQSTKEIIMHLVLAKGTHTHLVSARDQHFLLVLAKESLMHLALVRDPPTWSNHSWWWLQEMKKVKHYVSQKEDGFGAKLASNLFRISNIWVCESSLCIIVHWCLVLSILTLKCGWTGIIIKKMLFWYFCV